MIIKNISLAFFSLSLAACVSSTDSALSSNGLAAINSSASSNPMSYAGDTSSAAALPTTNSSSPEVTSSTLQSSSSQSGSDTPLEIDGDVVIAINAGSNRVARLNGVDFIADSFMSAGQIYETADTISGVSDDLLYQSERYGTSRYDIPVTNGSYTVVLHFAELYHTATGMRSFDVFIENERVIPALDLFQTKGHDIAISQHFQNVTVADEVLSINFESIIDNATISGIAVYSNNGGKIIEPPAPTICPTLGACKILPLGDSITDGVGMAGGGAYRIQLFTRAVEAGQSITFVGSLRNGPSNIAGKQFPQNHDGHSGNSINEIAAKIPNPILSEKPDIILLMIGTNDVWKEPENIRDPASMAQRLGLLLDKLIDHQPNALLAVALIVPRNDYASNWAQEYVKVIPAVVKARADMGFDVILVDQNSNFPNNGFSDDNLHPNRVGYTAMGDVWYEAIKGYLH